MKFKIRPLKVARSLLFAALFTLPATRPGLAAGEAGAFDYYALTLSWSPTYCRSDEGRRNRAQCGAGRRYSFVVHGLWPQHERGWPEHCATRNRYVPEEIIRGMRDIMPSKGLIIHEWRKHGTCSGLDAQAYFDLTRRLFDKIQIPARYLSPSRDIVTTPGALRADFLKTNPALTEASVSVQCGNRRDRANLRSLRICFSRDLDIRACGANERRQCRARQLVMPPVR